MFLAPTLRISSKREGPTNLLYLSCMSLIQWSPLSFEPFDDVDGFASRPSAMVPSAKPSTSLIPEVDVYESGDTVVVEAPMPGIDPKKIELSVDHGILTIKAVSERRTEVEEATYYRKEVRHGVLFRRIPLPSAVLEEQAQATYEQGILAITFPKRSASSTTIKIEAK